MSVLLKTIIMEIGSYIAGNGGYMSNENDAYAAKEIPANFPAEDLVLKSAMQFFGDELLSYLNYGGTSNCWSDRICLFDGKAFI